MFLDITIGAYRSNHHRLYQRQPDCSTLAILPGLSRLPNAELLTQIFLLVFSSLHIVLAELTVQLWCMCDRSGKL